MVFDRFSIVQSVPAHASIPAYWHTPLSPPTAPPQDGNIPGETFDFRGAGVPAVSGRSANLGQLVVNDDATSIYLGLRDVMVWPGQSIALFLAVPRLDGVTSLRGVGSSRGHPLAGLDLAFSGFRPFAVCLLGDEYADGTDPLFQR